MVRLPSGPLRREHTITMVAMVGITTTAATATGTALGSAHNRIRIDAVACGGVETERAAALTYKRGHHRAHINMDKRSIWLVKSHPGLLWSVGCRLNILSSGKRVHHG
jgi:hypothetical protein